MSDKISYDLMVRRIHELERMTAELRLQSEGGGLKHGDGNGTSGGMDLVTYRLDQFEKRADAADARMGRVEDKLTAIQVALAGLSTRQDVRNVGVMATAVIVATVVAVGALLMASAGNQLAAFQSGLSAVQSAVAVSQIGPHETAQPTQVTQPPQLPQPTQAPAKH